MAFVFYDLETTGLDTSFDQIVQIAAIRVNDELEIEDDDRDVFERKCRRLPHIVPSPGALTTTNVSPNELERRNLSHYEMMSEVAMVFSNWTPATFIGYNSIRFDETLLRQAFYQSLLPTYRTNTGGNSRADAMLIAQAVAIYAPESINILTDDRQRQIFKLGDVARRNGVELAEEDAHDALNDVRATLGLAQILRRNAPEIWELMMRNSQKVAVEDFFQEHDFFCHSNVFFGRTFNEVVAVTGRNLENPNEFALFNLGYDPTDYFGVDLDGMKNLLDSSPKKIRAVRTNSQPMLMPFDRAADHIRPESFDEDTYRVRAELLRDNQDFQALVSQALPLRYETEESPYVEKKIYDGFVSDDDSELMQRFHRADWSGRLAIAERFEDHRLLELAERLIYFERPDLLPPADQARLEAWVRSRLTTADDVPWMTVSKALIELQDIRRKAVPGAAAQLDEIDGFLDLLSRRGGDA